MTSIDFYAFGSKFLGPYCLELSAPSDLLCFENGSIDTVTQEITIGETVVSVGDFINEVKLRKNNGGDSNRTIALQLVEEMKAYRWEEERSEITIPPNPAQAKPAEPEPPSMPQPEPELEPATPPLPTAEPDPAPDEATDDAPERPAFPEPWRDQFEICIDAWFRYCDLSGVVSLRSFDQNDKGKPPFRITPTSLKGGLKFLMEAAEDDARRAAYNPKPIVFCPPIATFTNTKHAGEEDLFEGPVLSVDLDKNPRAALAMLERLLGPATLVVRSGGVWTNPQTGETEDKLHAHWRLKEPARGKEQLAKLKEARSLATILVDGDRNNIPISHPLRWPGSWHRKGTPRLCEIVEQRPDNEIDLGLALAILQKNTPKAAVLPLKNGNEDPNFRVAEGFNLAVEDLGEGQHDPHAELELVAAALAVIPRNENDPHSDNYWSEIGQPPGRDYMIRIGMAAKGACAESFELFDNWRSGAPDYSADTVRKKWEGFHPTSIGFGTLSFYADKAHPGWRERYEAQVAPAREGGVSGFDVSSDDTTSSANKKPPLIVELGTRLWGPATLIGREWRFGADQSKVIDPRRGAWFDFETNEGGFIRELMRKVNTAASHADMAPITYVSIAKWIGAPVPLRDWAVLNRVPARNVTVLSGTGGIGKTILAMMLAAAVVLSREWFGVIPEQGPVIFLSGEEDEEEMHRRFADIVQHLDVSYQDLINGGLHLIDKAGRNAMLACPGPSGLELVTTRFLEQLSADARRIHPKLVILDNRNMVYGGNINDPTQVSSFINTMRGFAIDANTAVILILHPSMAGIAAAADSSHQGLAGVMNWHDMPRGRMFFNRIKTDDDKEIDKDLRQLICKKNNYGPDDETIIMRWKTGTNGSGVFVMEPKPGSLEAMAENKRAEELFLSSLQRLNDQNRGPFSHKEKSNNYAPAAIAALPEAKTAGIKKAALAQAMDRLINAKKITIEPYGSPSKGWTKLVIADDPAMEKLAAILTAWKAAIDTNAPRTLQYVIEMANPRINPNLNAALLAVATDDGTTISTPLLTTWLQKRHRLPVNGLMLSSDDGNEWTLLAAATRAIREQLQQCGISDREIAQLTLEQAQNIIRERLPKSDYSQENR